MKSNVWERRTIRKPEMKSGPKKEDRMSESRERWCRKDKLRQGSTYSLLNHRIQHQESCWRTRHDQKKDIGAAKGESPVTLQYDRELLLESYFLTKDRKRSAGKDDQWSQTGKATIRISGSDDCQWWSSDELDNSSGSMHRWHDTDDPNRWRSSE